MYSSSEEIAEAIEKFRAIRIAANRPVLEKIIPDIERAPLRGPSDRSTKDDQRIHTRFLEDLLQSGPLNIDRPSEILERWDEFKHIVDGTSVDSDDTLRATRSNAFFSAVETGLKQKAPKEIRESIIVPPELRLLAEQVDVIWGPGLAEEVCKFDGFFFDLYEDNRVESPTIETELPTGPIIANDETGQLYEAVIGFQIGDGFDLECWAVLCRKQDDSDQPWEWRYLISRLEWGERIFDTIPDALACFATWFEPTQNGLGYWDDIAAELSSWG